MTTIRKITAATAALALAGTGVAAAAGAPVVGAQQTSPATTAPLTIPGTGVKKGDRLPSGARLVYRDVALEGNQKVSRVVIRAPKGKTIRGLAVRSGDQVGFVVTDEGNYVGRKQVASRAYLNGRAPAGEHTGRLYGLVR
jgi:hypothetical protein